MDKLKIMRIAAFVLWIVAGFLLIAAGICCFVFPAQVLSTLAYWIGALLLISGAITFVSYLFGRREVYGGESKLLESLLTFFLGLLMLLNNVVVSTVLLYAFSVWIIMVGIMRIMNSIRLKEIFVSKWWLILLEGIVCILLGNVSLFLPSATSAALGILAGVYLLLIGIALLFDLFFLKKFRFEMKRAIKQRNRVIIDISPSDTDSNESE